ncbi:MAG: lysine--tRNA ligase [Dehalococcoidia bacterium]
MSQRNDPLFQQRLAKVEQLHALGVDPYPARCGCTHTTAEALALLSRIEAGDSDPASEVSACGRIRLIRHMGKAAFIDVVDDSGRIQAHLRRDLLGDTPWAVYRLLDLGDFVEVSGPLFRTKTNEPTIDVRALSVLTKTLQPPPEKWRGVTGTELRLRHRYLDLMSSPEARLRFRRRSQVVSAIRRFMDARGFIEVETPVLQTEAGGAAAKPFTTYFNALDEERVLRISLELHLKRLLVGGFDKVYEIGRIFRNEGLSTRHNPEFTMMESYEAYADYRSVARMVEEMVSQIALEVLGSMQIPHGAITLDLTPPWQRLPMRDAMIQHAGIDFEQYRDEQALRGWMAEHHLHAAPEVGWGKLIDEVFSELVQPRLIQPIFITDYPIELSPLAKRKADVAGIVERFEPYIGGFEIGNAYSELNDPVDQRQRFVRQLAERARGDEEVELLDEDFLLALEHGMPPAGGLGIGIDRLLMILLDEPSIKEIILFPQLRTRDRTRATSANDS